MKETGSSKGWQARNKGYKSAEVDLTCAQDEPEQEPTHRDLEIGNWKG